GTGLEGDTPQGWESKERRRAIVEDDTSSAGVLKGIRGVTDPAAPRRTRPFGGFEGRLGELCPLLPRLLVRLRPPPQPVSTRTTPMTMRPMPISARRVSGSFQITRESRQTRATPQAAHSP